MPIRVLPVQLVNKIAAGEVIERPASVVKELVENALDAGALGIDVAIEDGGRRLIRVADDGAGMAREDLALAFAAHATSKIATEEDLFDIRTMGFRGEALASVAAVSRAHIRSRRRAEAKAEQAPEGGGGPAEAPSMAPPAEAADAAGYEVEAVGGEISPVRPCAAAGGTSVTVRDLFFNIPARRKFLRSSATELGHVAEQLTRLALPNPQVAFSLTHNGRTVLKLPRAPGTLERARDLFGEELAASLIPIARRGGGAVAVAGLIGAPASARASAKWQYFFLNGRYIRDRILAHALREAYRGACDPNRWPVGIVFLEIDPAEVDVNVHPTKIEVRFRESPRVHGELLAALRETLNRSSSRLASPASASPLRPQGDAPDQSPREPGDVAASAVGAGAAHERHPESHSEAGAAPADEHRRQSLRQAMADFFRSVAPQQPRFSFPQAPSTSPPLEAGNEVADEPLADWQPVVATRDASRADVPGPAQDAAGAGQGPSAGYVPVPMEHPGARPLAVSQGTAVPPAAVQVHDSYILAGCPDGVLIIDQHALHERILYNELTRRLAGEDTALEAQRLLIPPTLRVSPSEAATLAAHEPLLRRLGIEVTPFGPESLAVQEFPSLLAARGVRPEEFLRELLDELADAPRAGSEAVLEEFLAVMACKAAVKAGQPLSRQEIESLLAQAELAERSFACPHGRPAVLKLTLKDLEKQFKRT